jgi:hypothetical protein
MNESIHALHQQLITVHGKLADRLGVTTDREEAEALLREMEEVNFRVMMAGRLLFKQSTASIARQLEGIAEAIAALDEAIADIEKIKEVVRSIGRFLGLVDKALDAIKLT